jgi:DnaJ-class molecular chaperone
MWRPLEVSDVFENGDEMYFTDKWGKIPGTWVGMPAKHDLSCTFGRLNIPVRRKFSQDKNKEEKLNSGEGVPALRGEQQTHVSICPNCKGKGVFPPREPNFTEDLCAVCEGTGKQ